MAHDCPHCNHKTVAFKQWCDNSGLTTILSKFLEPDGKPKPQYITTDIGFEVDHTAAMSLHKSRVTSGTWRTLKCSWAIV
eukprot:5856254-Amphidinium_carterae.1